VEVVTNQASNHGFTRIGSDANTSLVSKYNLICFLHAACIDKQQRDEPTTVKLDRCMAGTHRTMALG
jgi:hypothetical protein